MRRPLKSIENMTPAERLTCALHLALTASSDARAGEVSDIADWLAEGLSGAEVECCKAIALAQWKAAA